MTVGTGTIGTAKSYPGQITPAQVGSQPNAENYVAPGYGAGYSYPLNTNITVVVWGPAFGAGYSYPISEQTTGPSPVNPVTEGNQYLVRRRLARAVPVITAPVATPPNPPATSGGSGGSGSGGGSGAGPVSTTDPTVLATIYQVAETYPSPTIVNGIPYNDTSFTPWQPSVTRTPWATQLRVVVGGQDVTWFRNLPTLVQSWSSQEPFGDASAVVQFPSITTFDILPIPHAIPVGAVVGIARTPTGNGYWQATALGLVINYGDAASFPQPLGLLDEPVSGIAAHPSAQGYVMSGQDGGAFAFGAFPFEGSLPGLHVTPTAPIVGIAATATGNGYWMVGSDGGVFAFGDAVYSGRATPTAPDVAVGIARSTGGNGYTVVCASGAIFAFGDAQYFTPLNDSIPIVAIGRYPGPGNGFITVNRNGAVFAYGSAPYKGGVNFALFQPANSVDLTPDGQGYWISAGDGGVFAYGDAPFLGSAPDGGVNAGGSLSWLRQGSPITLSYLTPAGAENTLFEGVVASYEDAVDPAGDSIGLNIQCVGCLFQLDWYLAKPIVDLPFQGYDATSGNPIYGWDGGQAIAAAINSVVNPTPGTAIGAGPAPAPRGSPFNGNLCQPVTTGILTVQRGAWDALLSSYIQNILSQMQTLGDQQYTLTVQRPRTPVITFKDFETISATVASGGRGVAHSLSQDISTAANAIYGQGTAPTVFLNQTGQGISAGATPAVHEQSIVAPQTPANPPVTPPPGSQPPPPVVPPTPTPPTPSNEPRIMVVTLENQSYSQVIGSSQAPNINRLANAFALCTKSYSIGHPSLPNYLEITAGSNYGVNDDGPPSEWNLSPSYQTIFTQLDAAGISWKAYFEDMPSPGYTGGDSGNYLQHHNPTVYFPSTTALADYATNVVPATNWQSDLNSSSPPSFVYYVPNGVNDGDLSNLVTLDTYAGGLIAQIQATSWYSSGGIIILTFDEGASTDNAGFGPAGEGGGGQIVTIVISAALAVSPQKYSTGTNSAGVLGSIERAYGLATLVDASNSANGNIDPLLAAVSPSNPTPTGSLPALGFYTRESPGALSLCQSVAAALGGPFNIVHEYADRSSWSGLADVSWITSDLAGMSQRLLLSVAIPNNADISQVASNLSAYTSIGNELVSAGFSNAIVRIMWEFNLPSGDNAWTAGASDSAWITAFQQISSTFKAVSGQNFEINWCPNVGQSYVSTTNYPGNTYVDSIGIDLYANTAYSQALSDTNAGLTMLKNFAVANGKKFGIPEYGPYGNDNGSWMASLAQWATSNCNWFVAFCSSTDPAANSDFSGTAFPNFKAAYVSAFG